MGKTHPRDGRQTQALTKRFGAAGVLLCMCAAAHAESLRFSPVQLSGPQNEAIRGAALIAADSKPKLLTWGGRVTEWSLPEGSSHQLTESGPAYGEGGCPMDVNLDGATDMVLFEAPRESAGSGRMVWLEAPGWKAHEIDRGADFRDCLPATLHGRRGVLVVHHQMQVRFYMPPEDPVLPWPYREIYSIYTPSQQGGLLLKDVNGDGFEDILCGNYWIRSPDSFELSWRLFAIDLWFEGPGSAMSRLAFANISGNAFPDLVVSQEDMEEARLAWFSKPEDPAGIWNEHRLEGTLGLRFPKALAAGDLDADGRPDIVVGEMNGPDSRLILLRNEGGGRFSPTVLAKTSGLLQAWIIDIDGDKAADILTVGPGSITWWRNQDATHLRK